MNNIIDLFSQDKNVKTYLEGIKEPEYSYLVNSLSFNHGYLLTFLTFQKSNDFVFYVASNLYRANHAYEVFCNLAGYDNVNLFVVDELVSTELVAVSNDLKYERINTLKSIVEQNKKIIVTHPQALLKPLINKDKFKKHIIELKINQTINPKEITKSLITLGYKKTPTTTAVGEFSIRGEVIDIYSLYQDNPVRINLFDIEIEELRLFDSETQKSIKKVDNYFIYPLNELIYTIEEKDKAIEKIKKDCQMQLPAFVENDFNDFENYNNVERINKYIRYLTDDIKILLDYVDNKTVFYEDYQRLEDGYKQIILDLSTYLDHLNKPPKLDLFFFFDFHNIFYQVYRKIFISEYKKSLNDIKLNKIYSFNGYGVIDYQNDIKNLINDLKANPNKTFVFALSSDERLNLVNEIIRESKIETFIINSFNQLKKQTINIIKCDNAISFGFFDSQIEVITEKEIFKQIKIPKVRYRSALQNSKPISSKEDLRVGDFVVHYDYGIGIYKGIKTIELKDIRNDYITLEYSNMELYIPVEKISLLEKYQGSEGSIPKLTVIGKNEWEKKKQKIKEKLETIALDLINLQAKRENNLGFKFPKDNEFQKLFEEDFEFEETKDQIKSIEEIKKDMEEGRVIDRLICGDVGYGKTEIAMRIAFKTVFANKQVAYLAPTTILTRQHYLNFKNRFEKYGIRVELMNRLVPLKKQKAIVEEMKKGLVDVVIGTHRLLSEDIGFRDLGLLIVDEEQRFGVVHKEKIKKIKENVNVLTLTATPIPRTLQMSIMGVRQLSLIETPPKDRYPIQTYVIEENDIIIKEAIYRELARQGQVFYLHNRIMDLDRLYRKLRRLVPEARIAIAHGQMNKIELENTIQAFIDKEYDVLLCTTIIETGIDIPNTNTLIIDNAAHLGLSQMYQIRGRVGRTDRIAYAYLMYEEDKVLTEDSVKRLNAIKEFTNLGSGYKIAVRDLAIRGAGDILGKEQSGFIDAIGLDMYMKMLNEAINKVKGIEDTKEEKKYNIEVSKHVDESYVNDDDIKILIHKEIYKIETKEEKIKVINEFTDRFGKLNEEILTYIEERYLQTLLKVFQVNNVLESQYMVMVVISKKKTLEIKAEKLFTKATEISRDINFEYKNEQIIIKIKKLPKDKKWIFMLSELLDSQL